ncbi:hypothetical protein [Flavobacterium silvaticum]|uniref:Uncharacterized protein n=1 Tax=Flavobacterium silvaticum TaxID=1852020 RepID=A0A972FVQ3_9FLAO|nr:hypothetical protein [Flavobacterium silvaticum]NMH28490.1 hypothetical protein [Flavobacterium silvaticum]
MKKLLLAATLLLLLVWATCHNRRIDEENSLNSEPPTETIAYSENKIDPEHIVFRLTHMMGEKMKQPAYFTLEGTKWTLDLGDGSEIDYEVISSDKYNPMCGIKAMDNFGDLATICVTKQPAHTLIQFSYADKTMTYFGELN